MRRLLILGERMKSGDRIYIAPKWRRIHSYKYYKEKSASRCIAGMTWNKEMYPVSRHFKG
jgi:hypothetical protein